MRRYSTLVLMLVLLLPAIMVWAAGPLRKSHSVEIRPTIPTADRTAGNRVFLERAERLFKERKDSFMILVGDVVFTKGPMTMRCDSAHYFADTESMNAYGNVSMEQGDTLFVFADELVYDGPGEVATLYANPGRKVRLINRDVELQTDVFIYNLAYDLGYYEVGGRLTDPQNTLTSLYGEYAPSTKEANFYTDVHLFSHNSTDTLEIFTDTLYYNTATHVAELLAASEVINSRGIIYTSMGVYDTDSNRTTLFDRSTVVTSQGQTLIADTIFYDRTAGYGEAFGNMVMTDSAHHVELHADYGFYDELTDSSFATGRALVKEFSNVDDTLYLHGRYIQSFRRFDTTEVAADTILGIAAHQLVDTTHVAVLYPRVRFYRSDMQGVADSLRFTQRDTTLRMYINPVVWNADQQIFGRIIELKLNDSTIERATLPDQAFTAQHIEAEHYNQMSGKEMAAYFESGEMRRLDINGSVEIIMYPEENDSTINKMVNAESSFLTATFKGRTTEEIKTWPQTTGAVTPLFLAKKSMYKLPKFAWYADMRPADAADVFIVPPAMEERMLSDGREPASEPPRRRSPLHGRPDGAENTVSAEATVAATDNAKEN